MRGIRILSAKHEVPMTSLAMLCEEREDEIPRSASQRIPHNRYNTGSPRSHSVGGSPIAPRLGLSGISSTNISQESFTPQFAPSTPITITSPSDIPKPSPQNGEGNEPQPPSQRFVPAVLPSTMAPPPHMAPQRGKWTSPPPDHAPPQRHNSFNERLATGIKLAVTRPQPERGVPPTRSSTGSSNTEDDVDEILDANSYGTHSRSSSPISSASASLSIAEFKPRGRPPIPEFEPRGRPPIRIQESPEEESVSTPKPLHDSVVRNGRNPNWRHSYQQTPQDFKVQPVPSHAHSSLPTLTIPQSMPFFSPNQYSPSAPQWMLDCGTSSHFGAPNTMRMSHLPPTGNGHGQGRGMRGNNNARHGNKHKYSPSPTTPVGAGHSRPQSFILPNAQALGMAMAMSTAHQLPTPPVSSPCSHSHLTPSPPAQPALRLEEPASTSAR